MRYEAWDRETWSLLQENFFLEVTEKRKTRHTASRFLENK